MVSAEQSDTTDTQELVTVPFAQVMQASDGVAVGSEQYESAQSVAHGPGAAVVPHTQGINSAAKAA